MESSRYGMNISNKKKETSKKKRIVKNILLILLMLIIVCGFWGVYKPMPEGLNSRSPEYKTNNVDFIYDLTYEADRVRFNEQNIFQNIYEIIDNAEEYIICDMFLFNDLYNKDSNVNYIPLSSNLTTKLIEKKKSNPNIEIIFITDPINVFYGAYKTDNIKMLEENDITVVVTNVRKLKDSNPVYSSVEKVIFRFIKSGIFPAYIPNAFSNEGPKVRLENYVALLNFKANHRKTISSEKETLITSANPHDASSLHSNIAFRISSSFANEVTKTELSVVAMSGSKTNITTKENISEDGKYSVVLVTEKKIKEVVIENINNLEQDDKLDLLMFYLSDRGVVKAVKKAVKRGVDVNLVLDANKDAFGLEKNGIPNRQVAYELIKAGANIRWYKTKGEQFHSKMIVFQKGSEMSIIGGSANFTRRNLNNLNLETNVLIKANTNSDLATNINQYINRINNNIDGIYTVDFKEYEEKGPVKRVVYWIQEVFGLSTF